MNAGRAAAARPLRRATARRAGAPRTAFVLAGGAALGAMQAGMLHALYERGILPDLLVGTSAGALNAAYVQDAATTWPPTAGCAAWPPAMCRSPAWKRPASRCTSLPGTCCPVRRPGGVANNTPISHAIALGAERVYILPTSDPAAPISRRPPRSAPAAAASALTRLLTARLQADLARYATAAEIITLPAANPQHIPLTSFTRAPQLITQALTAARTALAAYDTHPARARAS